MPIYRLSLKAKKTSKIPQNPKTLGDHIRKRRLELKLFQSAVAGIIGVEEASIYNWEKNLSNPSIKYIPKIIQFLGYAPDTFPQKTVGEKLIYYRMINGLSQKNLATILNINQTTLRRWESNKSQPRKKFFIRLSNVFTSILPSSKEYEE